MCGVDVFARGLQLGLGLAQLFGALAALALQRGDGAARLGVTLASERAQRGELLLKLVHALLGGGELGALLLKLRGGLRGLLLRGAKL